MNSFGGLQRLGKALMLLIGVLLATRHLLRLGAPDVLNISVMSQVGGALSDNLAAIFAVGIAPDLPEIIPELPDWQCWSATTFLRSAQPYMSVP